MQFRVIVVTDPHTHTQTHTQTNPQTGSITIHCVAKLSAQCNNAAYNITQSKTLKRACERLQQF